MRKGYILLTAILVTGLFCVSFTQAESFDTRTLGHDVSTKAHIGFGAAVSQDEILQLLHRHNVIPHAAFLWTSGITVTHRTDKVMSAQAFLQEVRMRVVQVFEKALRGNQVRLQHFQKMHTEEKVVADHDLQEEARALLNLRAALAAGLAAAVQGEPLIFSMEVSGNTAQMEQLLMDKMVKAFERAQEVGGRVVVPRPPKPKAYQEAYIDPAISVMSARSLYRWIGLLAPSNVREGV